ncbi:MAG: class I SAM-dependent methyltransferase, partial [Planctomycetaceae bacterium]|nr:class I SAM-dependent methyltransferase [Planctomycetaceae bacterium]
QITLLKEDYRKLTGTYDKLVTIEMIEAVGHQYFDTFFQKCGQLLKPEGEMLMQAITITDYRFEHHKRTVDFIKKYIFPGGCLPSVTALSESMARQSRMRMVHMEDFADHYAETLRRWRSAFFDKIDAVRELGFDDRFIRIWDYYLCYCEAAFMERHVNVTQLWFVNHASKTSPLDRELQRLPKPFREQGTTPRSEAARAKSNSGPGVEINEVVA